MVLTVNGEHLLEPEQAYAYLRELFGFPAYYGNNLDALYDMLTQITEPSFIIFQPAASDRQSGFYRRLLRVFRDAAEDNPALRLRLEDEPGAE